MGNNPFNNPPSNQPPAEDPEKDRLKAQVAALEQEKQDLINQLLVNPNPPAPPNPNPPAPTNNPPAPSPAPTPVNLDLETSIRSARQLCRSDHTHEVDTNGAVLFDRFSAEIDAVMGKMEAKFRGQVRIWEEVYYNVVGRHQKELNEESAAKARSGGPGGGERPPSGPPPAPAPETISDPLEIEMRQKLNEVTPEKERISEEQWIARRKQIREEGGQWRLPVT